MTITKADLAATLADETGCTRAAPGNRNKAAAERAVDAIFAQMITTLAAGGEVRIHGFGHFVAKTRPATTGHNPRTGAVIEIAAKVTPRFKAAKPFVDALNGR